MLSTLRITLIIALLTIGFRFSGSTQPGNKINVFKPDIKRQLFHAYVDQQQKYALAADGRTDNFFKASNNEEVNFLITEALTNGIDRLQLEIEADTLMGHNQKVIYIRGIENMLKNFITRYRSRNYNAGNLPTVLNLYESALKKDLHKESIAGLKMTNYEVGSLLVASKAFESNSGYASFKTAMLLAYCRLHPDQILYTLKENPGLAFQDSLIRVAAYKYPGQLYDYAAANNKLGAAIRKINDPVIATVSKMATSGGSGQIYFPFLDNLVKGKITFEEIDAAKRDSIQYYKLLVKTRVDYISRIQQKDTVHELEGLTRMLEKKAKDVFIRTINGLHDQPDAIRFRILQSLGASELYYLIVSSENEIYTSSYTKGVYPLMMAKVGNQGDSLLVNVRFDHFKKFIKMAAGFNTLNNFLSTFNKADAQSLMTAFVNGLEHSEGLEDGVDVADSYVSIAENNKPLAEYVLNLTRANYEKSAARNNHRGMVMYNLLQKLFLSADTSNNINLSQEFGIPPVYNVDYPLLANEKQQVVMQVFFYGDEDGQNIYQGFIRQFSNSAWTITTNPTNQWVTISSTRGKPIVIYSNKPLTDENDEDAKAQTALCNYLEENNLHPTVIIHRGHSYFAPSTIAQIPASAKIVFLGSCGGYHLINDVLHNAPDAHIIASKQIGKTIINQPFFNLLIEKLRQGNSIEWIPFWKEFGRVVTDKEGFSDYIPPHKNLGALFIKAYKAQMGETEEE